MTCYGLDNTVYQTGREIGRGGEGEVLEIVNQQGIVLKQYYDPVQPALSHKLRQMITMRNKEIELIAAWPQDLLKDEHGTICGFTMKKLNGYVPLHHLFSPMDRKKMFPDKGYNFLVHVARNLATAFHSMHQAGLVIGDVNEGNILVNTTGYVNFIDCDSFQLVRNEGKGYHYCEVGVPRYTPPELLKLGTFSEVVRTRNTDNFSMAILIFQLLFLGRHPFAGKTHTHKELDEESAIRANEFAYTLRRKRPKLSPPPDSFPITGLSDPLIDLFHRAFEEKERPEPHLWIRALEELLSDMQTCGLTALHSYPSGMDECPWCRFRNERGILYFLDDSFLQASQALNDIEQFVQGFRIEPLELRPLNYPELPTGIAALPIEPRLLRIRNEMGITFLLATGIIIAGLFIKLALSVLAASLCFIFYFLAPWRKVFDKEEKERMDALWAQHLHLCNLLEAHNNPPNLEKYNKNLVSLQLSVDRFRNLPVIAEDKRRLMEDALYQEQLGYYLACFKLKDHAITSIGDAKKTSLLQHGIENAADISRIGVIKIPGIGPKNHQLLLDWQRHVAAGFLYIPDTQKVAMALRQTEEEMHKLRAGLEHNIRKSYQEATYLGSQISHHCRILESRITEQAKSTARAKANIDSFRKMRVFYLSFLVVTRTTKQDRLSNFPPACKP